MRGYTLALTNGCFDVLHRGHTDFLTGAKGHVSAHTGIDGDLLRLVVGVNSGKLRRMVQRVRKPNNVHVLRNRRGERAETVAFIRSAPRWMKRNADAPPQAPGLRRVI